MKKSYETKVETRKTRAGRHPRMMELMFNTETMQRHDSLNNSDSCNEDRALRLDNV